MTDTISPPAVSLGSTDFVKKLFQMLEFENYKDIVRWASNGESFVVLDTNEFTKEILPKHFKHSNFASFVRQLNKYDFHKVKNLGEEKTKQEYGDDAWEFKHPDFRQNDRESLENIKRKGPSQKKTAGESSETLGLSSDVKSLMDNQKVLHSELKMLNTKYQTVVDNVANLKILNDRYHHSLSSLVGYLNSAGIKVPPLDLPDPFSVSPTVQQLLKSQMPFQPQHSRGSSSHDAILDPFGSTLSVKASQVDLTQLAPALIAAPAQRSQIAMVPGEPYKFHVLLVEDDNVCIQLCRKFLVKYGCTVEVVTDGLSAVSVVEKVKYDLVLMDIVMPNLDGASATSIIRSFDQATPIIAMTGNIEDADLVTYLQHGMSDILAKPFTSTDLYMMLEKHLINKSSGHLNGDHAPLQGPPQQTLPLPSASLVNPTAGLTLPSQSDELLVQPMKKQRLD
ncbi:hypothetical protein BABINDRAFT_161896 [Babjeviella inositovora NRRL Y-12698]|uniref:Transcription factor n=1 Tax=Babjeviella inositovora NRRL Y-12698 TaxID=984486 RepID=A0A1E3QPA9_9ASCO|nr:uncharacterized protein BABINDRAFT_161896 [Babjeviella inositovora NRRL Y-12698]ODQ79501.1 hypothetical protein BABINDRAFT_161896 [Babjeviella inositovora NRRL Y-12698]